MQQKENKNITRSVLAFVSLMAIFLCLVSAVDAKGIPCVKEYEDDGYALHATFSGTSMHIEVDSGAQAALTLKNDQLKEKYNQRLIRFASAIDLSLTAEEIRARTEEICREELKGYEDAGDEPVTIWY